MEHCESKYILSGCAMESQFFNSFENVSFNFQNFNCFEQIHINENQIVSSKPSTFFYNIKANEHITLKKPENNVSIEFCKARIIYLLHLFMDILRHRRTRIDYLNFEIIKVPLAYIFISYIIKIIYKIIIAFYFITKKC